MTVHYVYSNPLLRVVYSNQDALSASFRHSSPLFHSACAIRSSLGPLSLTAVKLSLLCLPQRLLGAFESMRRGHEQDPKLRPLCLLGNLSITHWCFQLYAQLSDHDFNQNLCNLFHRRLLIFIMPLLILNCGDQCFHEHHAKTLSWTNSTGSL